MTNRTSKIAGFIVIVMLSCCRSNIEGASPFPEVQNLEDLKNTTFSISLNSKFDIQNNSIYSPSFSLAWYEILNMLTSDVSNIENDLLRQVHTETETKVLPKTDAITTSVETSQYRITASAFVDLSLPFEESFERNHSDLYFDSIKVESFGFSDYSEYCDLVYYDDDNNFAIKLIPANTKYEIVLYKSEFTKETSFDYQLNSLKEKTSKFLSNETESNFWKYCIMSGDIVNIPCISFNISNIYKEIIGSTVQTKDSSYSVVSAAQRTAFVLNESGAIVQSEAEISMDKDEDDFEIRKPKKLIFDKPFMVFVKSVDFEVPLLACFISNTELLEIVN